MRAAVIAGPGDVEVVEVEEPTPGPDDAVIEVAASGICGTDLQILLGEHGRLPVIPGHELAGTVVAMGREAAGVAVGDRVAIDPSLPCRRCRACRAGRTNLCPDLGAIGVTVAGGAAEFVAAPANSCVVLPESIATDHAALIEPLSCAVHAFDIVRLRTGARVLVYGAGAMGLMLLSLANRAGASTVDIVDPNVARLSTARRLGCAAAAASAAALEPDDDASWDVVIDATGSLAAITDGLSRIAPGGTFLQFGVPSSAATAPISPYDIYRQEITITGSMAVLNSFERAVDLLAAGVIDPSVIVTRRAALTDYPEALSSFAAGHGLKTLVVPALSG